MADDRQRERRGKRRWTPSAIVSINDHWNALRFADQRFDAERDRRYTEVNIEREKALKIKEEADKAALGLAREIQTYKDEKANQLREQIGSERGSFATKDDLAAAMREVAALIQPLNAYVISMGGQTKQADTTRVNAVALVSISAGISATIGALVTLLVLLSRAAT